MEGVPGPSAVIEPRDLWFHGKIVFLGTEIFVFCIRQNCVLYSGKSDLLLAFAQQHGVILTEILGKGGLGAKPPSLESILLYLNKVRLVG